MGRELSHEEAVDLLGAFALDALDLAELQAVDRHVKGCPACTAEVAEHREVAGLLTPGWAAPPAGLWEKIASALEEAPPPLDLAPVIAMKPASPRSTAPGGAPRRRNLGVGIAAMVAVAAVAMVGFLGIRVADDRRRLDRFENQAYADQLTQSANAAVADPSARKINLVSTDGMRSVQAVVLPDGTGYVVKSNLPQLSDARTYQMWAVVGTNKISVGVFGPQLGVVPFKMDGNVSALAITEEVAGGVVASRADPVVVGKVQAA